MQSKTLPGRRERSGHRPLPLCTPARCRRESRRSCAPGSLAEILADLGTHIFLLEYEGAPVSSCVLDILPNLTRGARPYGLIENVVTRREFRNRGFGTALLGHALECAWNENCYKVMLLTGRSEPGVFRLYEKAGFVRGVKEGLIAYPPE